jgi:predicted nucleic acid-binding protein
MSTTLLDTNVLIDVLEDRPIWGDWSAKHIEMLARDGDLVINQIIYAEASTPYAPQSAFDERANVAWLKREDLPWDAAFIAAKAHALYREKGGQKVSTLPDFFIGAHATVKGYRLLTRDAARIRAYFPDVYIIAPDTHP